jgi:hypothetical protein
VPRATLRVNASFTGQSLARRPSRGHGTGARRRLESPPALRRNAATTPAATLIGRLRGVIDLCPSGSSSPFDGPPDPGLGTARIALRSDRSVQRPPERGRTPRPTRVRSGGPGDAAHRHRRHRAPPHCDADRRPHGKRPLAHRPPRTSAPGLARHRPPEAIAGRRRVGWFGPPGNVEADDERPGWQPGRGATKKKGNPKKGARRMPA